MADASGVTLGTDGQPVAEPARSTRGSNARLLVAVASGHAIKHAFNAGYFVLLPELKASLGLSNAGLGVLATIRSTVGGVANAPAGFIADRYASRFSPMLLSLMVFIGVFQFALGRSVALADAALWSALLSVAITAWHPPAIGALSRVFANRRGFAIAMHGTGASVGEATGPLIAGALLIVITWREVLQWSLLPAVLAGAAVWVLTREYRPGGSATSLATYISATRELVTSPRMAIILITTGTFAAGQAAVFTFLPIYVREDLGQTPWVVGVYVSVAQIAGIAAQPVMGYMMDRVGRRAVIVPALFVLGIALLVLYATAEGPLFLFGLALAGAFLFSVTAMLVTVACDVAGTTVQATTVAVVYSCIAIFTALGPLVAGFIADGYEVRAVFLYAGVLMLGATLLAAGATAGKHVGASSA